MSFPSATQPTAWMSKHRSVLTKHKDQTLKVLEHPECLYVICCYGHLAVIRWVECVHNWLHRSTQSGVNKVTGCRTSNGGTDFIWKHNHSASWYVQWSLSDLYIGPPHLSNLISRPGPFIFWLGCFTEYTRWISIIIFRNQSSRPDHRETNLYSMKPDHWP